MKFGVNMFARRRTSSRNSYLKTYTRRLSRSKQWLLGECHNQLDQDSGKKQELNPALTLGMLYVMGSPKFGSITPPRLWPPKTLQLFCDWGTKPTLSRALFLGSKCEINARDRAKGIADLSPSRGGGSIVRPLLSRKAARVDRLRLHTSQHARSPWILSLSLFHAKCKEAMAMSCKSFVCRNGSLVRICRSHPIFCISGDRSGDLAL